MTAEAGRGACAGWAREGARARPGARSRGRRGGGRGRRAPPPVKGGAAPAEPSAPSSSPPWAPGAGAGEAPGKPPPRPRPPGPQDAAIRDAPPAIPQAGGSSSNQSLRSSGGLKHSPHPPPCALQIAYPCACRCHSRLLNFAYACAHRCLCVHCNVVWLCACNCYTRTRCVNMCSGLECMLAVHAGRDAICGQAYKCHLCAECSGSLVCRSHIWTLQCGPLGACNSSVNCNVACPKARGCYTCAVCYMFS